MLELAATAAQTSPGVVGEVRVHGNHTTPNADILGHRRRRRRQAGHRCAGRRDHDRLEKSGRFDGVEVRKRFRSIENPDDILLMIVVDEVPGVSDPLDLTPGPMKKFWSSGMFLPIFHSRRRLRLHLRRAHQLRRSARPAQPHHGAVDAGAASGRRAMQLERAFAKGPVNRVAGEVRHSPP